MRKVLSSGSQVAHYFANQVQGEGRTANLAFTTVGGQLHLYSYQLCIARFTGEVEDGKPVCLVRVRDSTVTTNSHITDARRALANNAVVVEAFDVLAPVCHESAARRHVEGLVREYIKATSKTRDRRLGEIVSAIGSANRATAILEPDPMLRRQRLLPEFAMTEEQRVAGKNALAEAKHRAKLIEAERQAEAQRQYADRIARWKADTSVPIINLPSIMPVVLRVKGDMVQTSKGAEIPISHAKRLWPMIEAVRAGTDTFKPGTPLGVYKLSCINTDGSIVVGCHNIQYSEIEYIHSIIFKGEEACTN